MSDFWTVFAGSFAGGAAAGLLVLASIWMQWYLDRPLLKVSVAFGFVPGLAGVIRTSSTIAGASPKMIFTVRNPHSKPVHVDGITFFYKKKVWGSLWINPESTHLYPLPSNVDGGKSIVHWTSIETLLGALKEGGRKAEDLRYVRISSSSGKSYKAKFSNNQICALSEASQKRGV